MKTEAMPTEPILGEVKTALEAVDSVVRYGTAYDIGEKDPWNYIVYARDAIGFNENHTSQTAGITVAVTREGYVPDDLVRLVVKAVEAVPGMRVSGDIQFAQVTKPGTDRTVEQAIIGFTKAAKR